MGRQAGQLLQLVTGLTRRGAGAYSVTELRRARARVAGDFTCAWRDGLAVLADEGDGRRRRLSGKPARAGLATRGALAEASADAVARLLLQTLATLFPALCARHGEVIETRSPFPWTMVLVRV